MGGSSNPSTVTSSNTSGTSSSTKAPSALAAPYFPSLYATGENALTSNQSTPMPSQFVAGENPLEATALSQGVAAAPSLGASGGALSDLATKIASGYFTNPMNDPNFQAAATSAITPAFQSLTEGQIPGEIASAIKGGGVGGGPTAYGGAAGGSSLDVDLGTMLRNFAQSATNTVGSMAQGVYNQGMNLFQQAPGIAQGANAQILAPSQTLGTLGAQQQQYSQQAINNLLQQYQTALNAPWQGISQMTDLLNAGNYGTTTGTTTGSSYGITQPPQPSMATQILQGLTGGASALNSIFGGGANGAPSVFSNLMGGLGDATAGIGSGIGTALQGMGLAGAGAGSSAALDLGALMLI